MKSAEKLAAASKVVEYAKSLGFDKAALSISDDNDDIYSSIEEVAENYNGDDVVEVTLTVFLDNDITFDLVLSDEATEDDTPEIVFRD